MELYSDIDHIRRIQAGDPAGFTGLIDRYGAGVHAFIFRMVRNREDAEELTQDVFLKAFRGLNGFRGESGFSTWLYRIAYHTAVSEMRKRKQEFLAIDETLLALAPDEKPGGAFALVDEAEQLLRLDRALAQLPPEDQALILFFYMEEKKVEEIASATGLSLSNVKTRLHRIRKKLYVLLTEMEKKDNE
ncbi:MAG: RNA polymerase sigma factor [Tannerellaceae bacterium]|jgi:RNA polymerase sigma-70 factor (ECF subfamily)|nr:RNA polymerase sigma factor [Tannerellaceae bacterium]